VTGGEYREICWWGKCNISEVMWRRGDPWDSLCGLWMFCFLIWLLLFFVQSFIFLKVCDDGILTELLCSWTKHHPQEIQGICPHGSCRPSDQSTQLGHLSHLDSYCHSRSQRTPILSSVSYVWKLCFYVGTIQRICICSDDFCSDSTVILTTVSMDIGVRTYACGAFEWF
jgi:hypothetical protein